MKQKPAAPPKITNNPRKSSRPQESPEDQRVSTRTERIADWGVRVFFAIAVITFILAPILAITWSKKPFPGFFIEQTLVVSNINGPGWHGRAVGIDHPQRVIQIGEWAITTLAEFDKVFSSSAIGDIFPILTIFPDKTIRLYPTIELQAFSSSSLARLFWLPYGVGLSYLIIGLWIYKARGRTNPGREFAFFCACVAVVLGLFFDLNTTHKGSAVWTIAITQMGGALASLAFVFPEEISPAKLRIWLRSLAHGIATLLTVWGLIRLFDKKDPWAYIIPWGNSYRYAALAILIFIGMVMFRAFTKRPAIARQQARIILIGSLLAFVPVGIWMGAPIFGFTISFDTVIFLPFLTLFPLSIAIAIMRYRLWEIDIIINRTLVYSILTITLAAIYVVSVLVLEMLFHPLMGQDQISITISTLVIAALFSPLRRRIQNIIDQRFYRHKYDAEKALVAFSESLRNEVNLDQISTHLLKVVEDNLQPEQVILWLKAAPHVKTNAPAHPNEK